MPARSAFVASAVPLVGHQPAASGSATCPAPPPPPVRIAYEVHGTGPVHVLFVPGMCVCRRMWDAQLAEFTKKPDTYSLCLLDNRGTGESDIPAAGWLDSRNANYSVVTLARDAWAVADNVFGAGSKVHVIGWSMGSMIAQRYVLSRASSRDTGYRGC
jgi:pimeloyl-ACP methyl ester carboxylesterase